MPKKTDKLSPYKKVLAKARPKLDLKTPVKLIAGNGWFFDLDPSRKKFPLTCPPFSKENECAFLHYLCHAKILEDGWPMPITQTSKVKEDRGPDTKMLSAFINRSLDHFFDYFAWLLVIEKFGNRYFLRASKSVSEAKPKTIVDAFKNTFAEDNIKYASYLGTLDWFVLFHTLAFLSGNKDREKELEVLCRKLLRGKKFLKITVSNPEERVKKLRKFFRNIFREHPDYRSLLKNKKSVKQHYRDYYSIVWRDTGLKSEIKKFY